MAERFNMLMSICKKHGLYLLILAGIISAVYFAHWWLRPERIESWPLYLLLTFSLGFYLIRYAGYWILFAFIKPHRHKPAPPGLKVDAMTTAAPGEPIEMIQASLLALKGMTYPHETYLLDDSSNPLLKAFCDREGIHYITRTNKKKAKCGNVNNGLRQSNGDFVLIIDPDHIVEPHYLDHVLGHFDDPAIGYVQTCQAYYNQSKSFVAAGGAEQTYMFYGPVMMAMAGMESNPAIGTNCTFRRKALESIGLYKPGLAEDLHTSMAIHSQGWKSTYVPEILARGLTPEDLPAFFHQQLKWSRGVLELLLNNYLDYAQGWSWTQRILYLFSMSYYFESLTLLINLLLPIAFLFTGKVPANVSMSQFLLHLSPWFLLSVALFFYSQRWLCHRQERGLMWRGMLLSFVSFPMHLLGILYALVGKTIPYLPTAKISSQEIPLRLLVPHMAFVLLTLAGLAFHQAFYANSPANSSMLHFALWNIGIIATGSLCCILPSEVPNRLSLVLRFGLDRIALIQPVLATIESCHLSLRLHIEKRRLQLMKSAFQLTDPLDLNLSGYQTLQSLDLSGSEAWLQLLRPDLYPKEQLVSTIPFRQLRQGSTRS